MKKYKSLAYIFIIFFLISSCKTTEKKVNENENSIEIVISCGEDSNLEKYKGKVWNICLINMLNECYKPSMEIEVLNNRILEGGIKLSLWETKE